MTDEIPPPQPPVNWWESGTIRAALLTYLPGLLIMVKLAFKIDLTGSVDAIVNLIILILSSIGVTLSIIKRVKQGLNPAAPNPPIATPTVVTVVQRLTK